MQITAIGELVTLPLVVLVSFMAQPRLLYAMAKDGLLPGMFAEVLIPNPPLVLLEHSSPSWTTKSPKKLDISET